LNLAGQLIDLAPEFNLLRGFSEQAHASPDSFMCEK
jgi:hypothetical protein